MKKVRVKGDYIVYLMDDGCECEAHKDIPERDVITRYYLCKFLNPNRNKSRLEGGKVDF